jgi:hypothetical protein
MTCHDDRRRLATNPLVVHPDSIYRRSRGQEMLEEVVLTIPMRVFYPEEFFNLIRMAGFTVTGQWGDCAGELYGQGPGLVAEFTL